MKKPENGEGNYEIKNHHLCGERESFASGSIKVSNDITAAAACKTMQRPKSSSRFN